MDRTDTDLRIDTDRVEPAESGAIAVAVRRFGDQYPLRVAQWPIRLAGVLLVVATAFYLPWMLSSLNGGAPWLAWPFAVANTFSILYSMIVVANQWERKVPPPCPLPPGDEPRVAVIIPTCGEPVAMILRTVISVYEQDYPSDRLVVIVSDDGHDPLLRRQLRALDLGAIYHEPCARWAPGRDGAAKAGNLNSAVAMLDDRFPDIAYIETRDADDEVGSARFLRETVGHMRSDDQLAFVQSIKEAQVSAGDPFNNRESMFYRGQMLTRNAANAVFPCGSGLVWNRVALRDIGGFPTWNLVEDLQSGVEALRRGWHGLYLPIVGAVGQHSPEDLPNVYKQRGTWAIDTVRLMVWGNLKGLTLRQRAHFYGMLLDYLHAFAIIIYLPCLLMSLLGWTPLDATGTSYLAHILPVVLATELWLLAVNRPYNDRRTRQRHPYLALWRARIMWTGLAPIYAKASLQAILSGPRRKPEYRVTRKEDDLRWHWQHTVPQIFPLLIVAIVAISAVVNRTLPSAALLSASIYWGALNVVLLLGFVSRGWHGLNRSRAIISRPVADALATPTEPHIAR
jgi:cellulose synthase (UDP-forming)